MEKLQPDELKGVSETLLIPLHYRVEESRRETSAFRDEIGERFHDAIDYDWDKFRGESFHSRVMAARFAILDEQVKNFIQREPEGIVVNLGAGLDTRFHRLDNGTIKWIELDLPAVIAFRRKLQEPESTRHRFIAASVFEDTWVAGTMRNGKDRILLVAEGLLPYFTEEEHKHIFGYLADAFRGQEMLFHTMAPSLVEGLVQYSNMSKLRANVELQWGLDDSTQVSSLLNSKVRFVGEFSLLEGYYGLLPEQIRQKLSPDMAKKIAKIVHVRFDD